MQSIQSINNWKEVRVQAYEKFVLVVGISGDFGYRKADLQHSLHSVPPIKEVRLTSSVLKMYVLSLPS